PTTVRRHSCGPAADFGRCAGADLLYPRRHADGVCGPAPHNRSRARSPVNKVAAGFSPRPRGLKPAATKTTAQPRTANMTLNERAHALADRLARAADVLRIDVHTTGGCRVLDCGVQAAGGLQAGLGLAR